MPLFNDVKFFAALTSKRMAFMWMSLLAVSVLFNLHMLASRDSCSLSSVLHTGPYDELRRRHTSFAKIVIYPDVGEFEALSGGGGGGGGPSLTRDDVCIETFRSSGPGNKTICFQCEIVTFGQEVNTRRKRRAQ